MIKEIIDTLQSFFKREVNERLNEIENNPDCEKAERVHRWFMETGLYRATLDKQKGGVGLSERDVCIILREVGKVYPSFGMWLLSHYLSVLLLERISERYDENQIFGTNLFFGKYAFTSPFAEKIICVEKSKLSIKSSSSLLRVKTLGLKGCKVYEVKLYSGREVDKGIIHELGAKGSIWTGAISVGNAISSVEGAIRYASTRYQGGDVIIKHGIIREMLGRMRAKVFASDSTLIAASETEKLDMKRLSKAFITETCEQVCCDSIQILGGYGYMKDYEMERRFRDSKTLASLGKGNIEIFKSYGTEKI